MGIETKTRTIDDMRVDVSPFPARKAIKLKVRIIKKIAPVIGELAENYDVDKSLEGQELSSVNLAGACQRLSESLEPDDFLDLLCQVLQGAVINGVPFSVDTMDVQFTGDKLFSLYKIAGFVLEVNYSSFFGSGGIGTLLKSRTMPPIQKTEES